MSDNTNQPSTKATEPTHEEKEKSVPTKKTESSPHEEEEEHEPEGPELLPPSKGLTTAEAEELLATHGRNELVEHSTPSWLVFLKCLWGPMPGMLWAAGIIEFALENYIDGAILFAILLANAVIGWYETIKAGNAVRALKDSLKPTATVHRDGKWVNMDAALVVPGDLVKLAAGSAVPADCSINEGEIDIDEAALTGESLPVTKDHTSSTAKMGSNVVRGEVDGTVQFTGMKTFFGKTAMMIGSVGNNLGNVHYIIIRTVAILTAISLTLCLIVFIYLLAGKFRLSFRDSLEFTVVLLVVSVPLAVEIVVTTTLALGSKELSTHKVIVTQLSSIEMMAAVDMLCSDKTGTLTQNKMQLQESCPVFADGHDRGSVLQLAALAAKWREPPRDALDTMVLGAADLNECDEYDQLEFMPFDPRVKRTQAKLRKEMPNGETFVFKVAKGAPHAIGVLCGLTEGPVFERLEEINQELSERGIRCIAIAQATERAATQHELTAEPIVQDEQDVDEELRTTSRQHSTVRRNSSLLSRASVGSTKSNQSMVERPRREDSAVPRSTKPSKNLSLEPLDPARPKSRPSLLTKRQRAEASKIPAATDGEEWKLIGLLTFLDPPRPDTKETIRRAKEYGVDVKMITGDDGAVAREMCRMLDMDPNIQTPQHLPKFPESGNPKDIPNTLGDEYGDLIIAAGGFARVFPEHKYLIVETLRQCGYTCAMTGDGVNDAPALKRADVGIAVEGATDAARAAADMILTNPGLGVVVEAMLIARGVFQRIQSFLTYRIAATLQLVTFFFISVFALPCEDYGMYNEDFKFFKLPVLLFMLITLLNDGTLIAIGYDNVTPSNSPQRWNLTVIFIVSTVLAAVALASSLWLLWMGLDAVEDSHYANSWFNSLNIPQMTEGKVVTMIYLKVSISDFLTLFSARTGDKFFFSTRPSLVLLCGAGFSLLVSSLIASLLPDATLDNVAIDGLANGPSSAHKAMPVWVWLYCLFWWFVQDLFKVGTHYILRRFNLFEYKTELMRDKIKRSRGNISVLSSEPIADKPAADPKKDSNDSLKKEATEQVISEVDITPDDAENEPAFTTD